MLTLVLCSCASYPNAEQRSVLAMKMSEQNGFLAKQLALNPFHLQTFYRFKSDGDETLTVYIEGDGFAWVTRTQPSFDPTPINPMVLKMAFQDDGSNVAYLARPCQYTQLIDDDVCDIDLWTDARFSEKVVASMNEGLDQLKTLAGVKYVRLMAFSGGGAIAVLVAARRNDVAAIVTVAGNLNPHLWVKKHGVSALGKSLDPMAVAKKVAAIPQVHFSGAKDKNISPEMADSFKQASGNPLSIQLITLPNFSHACCWAEQWPELLNRIQKEQLIPH